MKLLATTTRYYLLLAALLFAAGTAALYAGLVWALRSEMEEKLVTEQGYLTPILQRTGRLPLASTYCRARTSPLASASGTALAIA